MITKKTANKAITTPITGVVPHPGATFPYSEFKGFSIVPNVVTLPFEFDILFFDIVVIIYKYLEFIYFLFTFSIVFSIVY